MKNQLLLVVGIILLSNASLHAQEKETQAAALALKNAEIKASTNGWKRSGIATLTFGQTSLTNWVSGGDNTISGNIILNGTANYRKDNWFWDNNLSAEFGLMRSSSTTPNVKKATDRLNLNVVGGIRYSEKFAVSGLINFSSQFAKGYDYSNYIDNEHYNSTLMTPGYLDVALGITYKPNSNYNFFISPLAERAIFVLNDSLSSIGSFGVDPGKKIDLASGAYLMANTNQKLLKTDNQDLSLISTLYMFTPYNQNFGIVDATLNILLTYKLNKAFTTSLNTTFRYYRAEIDKIQVKELFGLGISYQF